MEERPKQYLLWGAIALTTLPFFALVRQPAWGTDAAAVRSMALYLGASFGYVGVALLLWNVILGTRSIAGLYFADLPRLLKVHRLLGTYGMLFVFLHPLLILVNYRETLSFLVRPDFSSTFATHVTYGRLAFLGVALLWLTSAALRGKMAYRPWKYLHYLSYPVLVFALLHVPGTGSSFPERGIQFYWLTFCVVAIVALALRLGQFFGYGKVPYRVVRRERLGGRIAVLRLVPVREGAEVRPGQYVYLQSRAFGEEHPFSVFDYEARTGRLTVAFKASGRFTEGLADVPEGDVLMLDGPYGTFTKERNEESAGPAVYIAGGIGITPFAQQVLRPLPGEQYVFWANQTRDHAVFRDLFRRRLGSRFVEVYSRERTAADGAEIGYVDAPLLAKYLPDPGRYQYFVCGPQGMMLAVRQALAALGVPEDQVHAEEFGF